VLVCLCYCVLQQQAGVEPNDFTRHALIKALQSGGRETENVLTAIMQEFNKENSGTANIASQ
jgi:hypothetical protein